MTAFLWHLTALFGVLAVAPRPATASASWWATRPLTVAATLVGTAVLVAMFRGVERPRPLPVRPAGAAALGAAASALGLLAVSATGAVGILTGRTASLAGAPVTMPVAALLLLAGALLTGVPMRAGGVRPGHVAERP
jgi:hypothetical protein